MSSLADATFAFAGAADAASQSEAAGSSPLTDFSNRIARPRHHHAQPGLLAYWNAGEIGVFANQIVNLLQVG